MVTHAKRVISHISLRKYCHATQTNSCRHRLTFEKHVSQSVPRDLRLWPRKNSGAARLGLARARDKLHRCGLALLGRLDWLIRNANINWERILWGAIVTIAILKAPLFRFLPTTSSSLVKI